MGFIFVFVLVSFGGGVIMFDVWFVVVEGNFFGEGVVRDFSSLGVVRWFGEGDWVGLYLGL